ncbi:papain-like cysteine protease family protein [Bradyrhizobium sp. RDT10]
MDELEEVSVIDRTRIPLNLSAEESQAPVLETTRELNPNFKMQQQCHSNWCWAAVASSVSGFNDETSTFTQCLIANLELHREDCCDFACGAENVPFDVPHTLGSPLNRVCCLERMTLDQRATRMEVQQEINAGRPLCVRTLWSGGGGAHFLAIVGYLPDTDSLVLEDPLYGPTPEIKYDRFCTQYQDAHGVWTDTYYTKAPD